MPALRRPVATPTRNLLDMVPRRTRKWVTDDSGTVRVLVPRYGESDIGRWVARSLGRPHIAVKLDELGSAVWEACDGAATVAEIAARLERRFGERTSSRLHDRLARYFRDLEHGRLIRWNE